ncbi:MAG: FAD-binding protein [Candidatus Eremiobacteraeota bacterium]|nr:FAD-binding protein [Candidatus Eremiobacteraeota bacterium]
MAALAPRPLLHDRLARQLSAAITGDVRFDTFSRGFYATDASIYQIMPLGVVIPKTDADVEATLAVAREHRVPITPRGAGTSQCGQTIGSGLVVDVSKHLRRVIAFDADARTVRVQPGIVLDELNRFLRPHGLFFPVDPSTASRATIGGMTANNSSGSRSIRYGNMIHNVRGIDAILADGTRAYFGDVGSALDGIEPVAYRDLVARVRAIAAREASEIESRIPKVLRRVGGYNVDTISAHGHNLAQLLVGSEGTLAYFAAIDLALQPIPKHKTLGICHFPRFYDAMTATGSLVELEPVAVELVDRTMLELSRDNPTFAPTIAKYVRGEPDAVLLVEFAGDDAVEIEDRLDALDERMRALGYAGAVVKVRDPAEQAEVWSVRAAGLNIMTSMKGDAKPVSIIEDCAVPLEHLADYTERLTRIFERHGTRGTWYAHASVGCLHVRPVLNMKSDLDVRKLRSIAEEAFAIVREYGGAHSGEHGDGIVRSEFHREMFGDRIVAAFEEIKDAFDPAGVLNPGKIVRAPKMDDRTLFRFGAEYAPLSLATNLDWSEWGGFSGAVEMCNNNGLCRKDAAVMCPSYLATSEEQHVTRGRANALRLALSGQLGKDAFTSEAMYETLDLCVSCKACRRECPTGVDMAKMKVEFLAHYRAKHGLRLKDRVIAHLPRLAPLAARFNVAANARNRVPMLRYAMQLAGGIDARRELPRWRRDVFHESREDRAAQGKRLGEVVLLVDTFNRYFSPEIARSALAVLRRAGYHVTFARAERGAAPLCCGRTYLSAGLVDDARGEARRTIAALLPFAERGVPIVGLEPSCLLTLRDEFLSLLPGPDSAAVARCAMLFEEFLAQEIAAGRFASLLRALPQSRALLHGHCHQKAFGAMPAVVAVLGAIPKLSVSTIESSCCGMAGTFGYEREHYDVSQRMAERSLLPAVRGAPQEALIVTDGMSCRHQIEHGTERTTLHVAQVLERAMR